MKGLQKLEWGHCLSAATPCPKRPRRTTGIVPDQEDETLNLGVADYLVVAWNWAVRPGRRVARDSNIIFPTRTRGTAPFTLRTAAPRSSSRPARVVPPALPWNSKGASPIPRRVEAGSTGKPQGKRTAPGAVRAPKARHRIRAPLQPQFLAGSGNVFCGESRPLHPHPHPPIQR